MSAFLPGTSRRRRAGQGMVETGLVMGLIAILAVATLWVLSEWLSGTYVEEAEGTGAANVEEFYDEMADIADGRQINSTSGPSTTSTTTTATTTTATTTTSTTSTGSSTSSTTTTPTSTSTTTATTTTTTTTAPTTTSTGSSTSSTSTSSTSTTTTTAPTTTTTTVMPNTPPVVTITSPAEGAYTTPAGAFYLRWTISDAEDADEMQSSYADNITITVGGDQSPTFLGGKSTNGVIWQQAFWAPSSSGKNYWIKISVTDNNGATTEKTINLTTAVPCNPTITGVASTNCDWTTDFQNLSVKKNSTFTVTVTLGGTTPCVTGVATVHTGNALATLPAALDTTSPYQFTMATQNGAALWSRVTFNVMENTTVKASFNIEITTVNSSTCP